MVGGDLYIQMNVQFECHTKMYAIWTGACLTPMLIFWILVGPLFFFTKLRNHFNKENKITKKKDDQKRKRSSSAGMIANKRAEEKANFS